MLICIFTNQDGMKRTDNKKNNRYLSGKEIREIAKENLKVTKALEKRKHRRASESEFVTEMKDDSNILKVGDEVKRGDKIGTVGDTSLFELADEPHLHFEMVYQGKKVNPMDYLALENKK